jgi:hypothetical protein
MYGFIQIEGGYEGGQSNMMFPLVLVIITLLFGVLNVFLARVRILTIQNISDQTKNFINTVTFIGMGLVSAIPIVSFVALFTMMDFKKRMIDDPLYNIFMV